jgi:hypothetical protein
MQNFLPSEDFPDSLPHFQMYQDIVQIFWNIRNTADDNALNMMN